MSKARRSIAIVRGFSRLLLLSDARTEAPHQHGGGPSVVKGGDPVDLGLLLLAFHTRDESTDHEVRALTDKQVMDALNTRVTRKGHPKHRTPTYPDPTGEQACGHVTKGAR